MERALVFNNLLLLIVTVSLGFGLEMFVAKIKAVFSRSVSSANYVCTESSGVDDIDLLTLEKRKKKRNKKKKKKKKKERK